MGARNSLLLFVLALTACVPPDRSRRDPEDPGEPPSTMLEGIYELTAWTRNESGCTAEGSSILAAQASKRLLVRASAFEGQGLIEVASCGTLDECRQKAGSIYILSTAFIVHDGSDAAGWTGSRVLTVMSGDTCQGTVTETDLTSPTGMQARVELRSTPTGEFAATATKTCSSDDARAAAEAMACGQYDVLVGGLVETLP
jgi:hypothetical protein